ncbi:putative leucine-rich repeat-containing, plant-type, leucine-rich repeat domain superfamily [Helianthus annuus]|nr:putative leucine-rich repeat-containing, plant-type, leucine-rich repeat domain superfamily [Helianthus annuus]
MNNVLFILSPIELIWFKTTTVTSFGHQLIAAEGAANHKCVDKERHDLLHFKPYISQNPIDPLPTWTTEEEATNDCCKWEGVTCDNQTGHVTSLDLSHGHLEGKISPSLLNLSDLNHLDLFHIFFMGPFHVPLVP